MYHQSFIDLIPAPDYPTGALIMGRSGIKKAYRTGKGNAILRARAEIEDLNLLKYALFLMLFPNHIEFFLL